MFTEEEKEWVRSAVKDATEAKVKVDADWYLKLWQQGVMDGNMGEEHNPDSLRSIIRVDTKKLA
eukprot:6471844-Amphidinium_carterae.1